MNWLLEDNGLQYLAASKNLVYKKYELYRIITTCFIHSDFSHYISNAVFLLLFGFLIWSNFSFWIYPLLGIIGGATTNLITLYFYPSNVLLIGASGIVYYIAGFWLTLYYHIERDKSVINRLIRIAAVTLVVFFPTQYDPNISYLAHAIGISVGVLSGFIYFYINKNKIRSHEVWERVWPDETIEINQTLPD